MRFLSLLITIPLTLLTIVFVAYNTETTEVVINPIRALPTEMPLYYVGLAAMLVGFLSGALMVWISSYRLRIDKWQETRRTAQLEKEIEAQKVKIAKLESEQARQTPPVEAIQMRQTTPMLSLED